MFILVCHLSLHCRNRAADLPVRMPFFPWRQYAGLVMLAPILITMESTPSLNLSWVFGIPWVILISSAY